MLDDCYFYLYSECKLKERCRYRHNPLSKDNLILCKNWSKNKKCRMDCPLRHSLYHVVKQRSDTMCYWEDKGGCTKYRCEFKHIDASKDEWKEPKVKLLTEIIESKNMHISEASTSKINVDETSPVTISVDDAQQSTNNDVTISDAQVVLIEDKECTSVDLTSGIGLKSVTSKSSDELLVNYEMTAVSENHEMTAVSENHEMTTVSGNHEMTTVSGNSGIPQGATSISEDVPSVQNQSSILIEEKGTKMVEDKTFSKRKTESQSEPKKAKTDNLDFDIDNLDKEIAELEELLNDP